jgi:hypothetical protein
MSSINASLSTRVPRLGVKREASYDEIATVYMLLAIAAVGIAVSLYVDAPVWDVTLIGP